MSKNVVNLDGRIKEKRKQEQKLKTISACQERRDELFCEVIARLESYDLQSVAEEAGVSYSTLWCWIHGPTVSPLLSSLLRVCEAIELEVQLIDTAVQSSKKTGTG